MGKGGKVNIFCCCCLTIRPMNIIANKSVPGLLFFKRFPIASKKYFSNTNSSSRRYLSKRIIFFLSGSKAHQIRNKVKRLKFDSRGISSNSKWLKSLPSDTIDSDRIKIINSFENRKQQELYNHLIDKVFLPDQSGLLYGFAYGSGVFPQSGGDYTYSIKNGSIDLEKKQKNNSNNKSIVNERRNGLNSNTMKLPSIKASSTPMVDIVLVVQDSELFHRYNLQYNSSHYSFLKYCGPKFLAWITDSMGAGLYYNTMIDIEIPFIGKEDKDDKTNRFLYDEKKNVNQHQFSLQIKYGIISMKNFALDLENWKWMYLAGRLHKPVYSFYLRDTSTNRGNNSDNSKSKDSNTFFKKNDEENRMNIVHNNIEKVDIPAGKGKLKNGKNSSPLIQRLLERNLLYAIHASILLLLSKAEKNKKNLNKLQRTKDDKKCPYPSEDTIDKKEIKEGKQDVSYIWCEKTLYTEISALSYAGDFRMKVGGENPQKVQNIVVGSFSHFTQLYRPLLCSYPYLTFVELGSSSTSVMNDNNNNNNKPHEDEAPLQLQLSSSMKREDLEKRLYSELPSELVLAVNKVLQKEMKGKKEDIKNMLSLSQSSDRKSEIRDRIEGEDILMMKKKDYIYKGLANIISSSSWSQGMKGVWTAGPTKAFQYAIQKLKKGILKHTSFFF